MNKIALRLFFISLIAGLPVFLSFKTFRSSSLETVRVEGGLISGSLHQADGIHIFKGIPFAAPPIGNLRWKAPQAVIPWKGIRKCESFGASPMQGNPSPFGPWSEEYLIPKEPISEDCLYLNVWTGAKKASEKRPVLVWIYGGGFMSGGSAVPIYDGEAMAKKGIVFVSFNYRVGVFGFFAHSELTRESPHHASGNYGLMDQIAALKWVQKNISAFGGDPGNVTIAGQSAGSMSVNCLVASPLSRGLFHHAIAESGASFVSGQLGNSVTLKNAEEAGLKLTQFLNATSLNDLRNIPADQLLAKAKGFYRPIIDGYVLPHSIAEIFAEGQQNDVPVLTGWNQDDAVIFGKPKTAEEFKQQLQQQYGEDAQEMLKFYPANTDEEAARSQAFLSRDLTFGIQNYSWGIVQIKNGKSPVYIYRFSRKLPATGTYARYGAFHTGEVAYAYDNLEFVKRCPWEHTDHELAGIMSTYWVNFATTGNPNGKGLPDWPAFTAQHYPIMVFGDQVTQEPLPDKAQLDFLISKAK